MHFDKIRKQWLLDNAHERLFLGELLREEVLRMGVNTIDAGTVMVFSFKDKTFTDRIIMFQTMSDFDLIPMKNTSLLFYEEGSIIFLGAKYGYIPTFTFRNCRFPTIDEFERYERSNTV